MKRNKDNQREDIVLEMTGWAFVIGILYMIIKLFI